jgi:hypothetical protein
MPLRGIQISLWRRAPPWTTWLKTFLYTFGVTQSVNEKQPLTKGWLQQ